MGEPILPNIDVLVQDNIRTLALPSKKTKPPLVILLVGPPFSGKTTLVSYLAKKLPLAVLSEEKMREFLSPRATFFNRGEEEIFLLASKTIEVLLRDQISCIYDASIKRRADRDLLRDLIKKVAAKLVVISLAMDAEEGYKALRYANAQVVGGGKKGFIMDKELYRYEVNTIEKPTVDEQPFVLNAFRDSDLEKAVNYLQALLKI